MNPGEGKGIPAAAVRIEAAVESPAEAAAAERAGAARVELCADLDVGGLTPSPDVIAETVRSVSVPVHVMVRPRAGNFVYAAAEVEAMCRAAGEAGRRGAAGIVFGALLPDDSLDEPTTKRILAAAGRHGCVFHRAFDQVRDPFQTLECLMALGIGTVLTSGGPTTAFDGMRMLRSLVDAARGRVTIMPGGSVTGHHVRRLVEGTGVSWVHARSGPDACRISDIARALRA